VALILKRQNDFRACRAAGQLQLVKRAGEVMLKITPLPPNTAQFIDP